MIKHKINNIINITQMKITLRTLFLFTILSSLIVLSIQKSRLGKSRSMKHRQPLVGGYSNSVSDILQRQANFKNPKIYEMIPLSINSDLNTGRIEEANSVPTNSLYYNGAEKLNAIKIMCQSYDMFPTTCVQNAHCGWCGSSNTCVAGTPRGPLGNCLRNAFIFNAPNDNWSPFTAGNINLYARDKQFRPILHLTPTPDMENVYVNKPYM